MPFLRWAGGKRWFINQYSHLLPTDFRRHIEPFLGSGAVFFSCMPSKSLLSDSNSALIETFLAIREDPFRVFIHLREHQRKHCKTYYYRIRDFKPRSSATRAARFIYLNRTCFNGLYRVNLSGKFNVPKGTKDAVFLPDDDLIKASKILRKATIRCEDFEVAVGRAQLGDFLYIDPPYTVKHNNNNFVRYNEKIFSWKDQVRLAEVLTKAAERGVYILTSNANHNCIRKLYDRNLWELKPVKRRSVIAGNPDKRGETSELVITNY